MRLSTVLWRHILVAAVLPLIAASCSPSASEGLVVYNGKPVYTLAAAEHEAAITPPLLARYQHHIAYDVHFSQPLARVVEGPGHQVYLGLLLEPGLRFKDRLLQADSSYKMVASRSTQHGKLAWLSSDSLQVVRCLATLADGSLFTINYLTADTALAHLAYAQDSVLLARLH